MDLTFEMPKSQQNRAFYGHRYTYSGKAHCIKDRVLLDETCGSGGFMARANNNSEVIWSAQRSVLGIYQRIRARKAG